jgi:predicted ferric reductase/mono/diheme cytochrome c family protein
VTLTSVRGPLALVVLCAAPCVLWARSAPLDARFDGAFASLTSVAVLFAFAGTSAFALNLVLGARLRLVESLFGGLDRMYKVHRVNGRIAFVLLLGHAILIFAGRATISAGTALHLLEPDAGWPVFAGVLAFAAMTVAIVLTLFVRLGHEVFVYVQRSFGFIFLVAAYHVFTTPGARDDSLALNVYVAALATLGVAAFAYRSLLGNLLVRRRPYRVAAVNRLDEFVTEIVMEPLRTPLAFTPGQFVFVNFRSIALSGELHPFELSVQRQVFSIRAGEVGNQFHPFSITSAPGEPTLRITVKAVGDYTRALRMLEAGADAVVEGPYGSFSHRNVPNDRQVWIAGGIGVTPFLSMARSLGTGNGPSVDFYYCVEHEREAHFLDELRRIAGSRDDFRVTVVARDGEGFLTAKRLADEQTELASSHVLVCGPPAMIDSLRPQLRAEGVPDEQVHAEEFGFAKLGRSDAGPDVVPGVLDPRTVRDGPPPGPRRRWSEGQVLALFAALAFAALMFALGVAVGDRTASRPGRGEAGATTTATGSVAAGKAVFASAGCAGCHALTAARVRDLVANGRGAMPAFQDEQTRREIRGVGAFVAERAGR